MLLNDFSFEEPSLKLQAMSDCGRDPGLEFSDYPGAYVKGAPGARYATLRAEEFESARVQGVGMSNSPRITVGKKFELTEHPSESMNQSYLVTSVTHQGRQSTTRTSATGERSSSGRVATIQTRTQWMYHAGHVCTDPALIAAASGVSPLDALTVPSLLDGGAPSNALGSDAPVYDCRFECIPADVVYRPPRITRWPKVYGTQTARVVGPPGEEIHCDEYGRVKLQFNWDREGGFADTASCWIRVSQGMAGGSYGMMFLPRVGQEVIVDFLEGDPDKPIVVGRVYNADHMPPYTLPDEKTKSVIKTNSSKGKGTNEIRFEDLAGEEQLLINAQKDFHVNVENDRVETIGHDHHLSVKENKFELVEKESNREVKLDLNETVGGNTSYDVTGNSGVKVGGNYSLEVDGDIYIKAGGNLVLEGRISVTVKAGGNFVTIDPSGVTILGTMVKVNSGGSAGGGSAVSLLSPQRTVKADTVKPGKDTTYSDSGALIKGKMDVGKAGSEFEPGEFARDTSWVAIELVDEVGDPVPDESYEVLLPNGNIRNGTLTARGQAYIPLPTAEEVQISFPRLDTEAWIRDTGAVPPPTVQQEKSPPPDRQPEKQDKTDMFYDEQDEDSPYGGGDTYGGNPYGGDLYAESDGEDSSAPQTGDSKTSTPPQQKKPPPPRRNPYKK